MIRNIAGELRCGHNGGPPRCDRKLADEKALMQHLRDKHGISKKAPDLPKEPDWDDTDFNLIDED